MRVRRRHFILDRRLRRPRRITTGIIRMAVVGRVGIGKRRYLWEVSAPMRGVCMTCTATYGSGLGIAGTTAIQERLRTERRGGGVPARSACCAAARGASYRGSCARRSASGIPPADGSSSSGFVLPGRLRLESLPLYVLWGVQGGTAPLGIFGLGMLKTRSLPVGAILVGPALVERHVCQGMSTY